MTSASSQSSSTSSPLGSGQTTTMALTSSYQQLNHALPVKLDLTNYVLWKSQIDNIVVANCFEDFIDGTSVCPEKELSACVINPTFIAWRRQDHTILSWITRLSHQLSWHKSLDTLLLNLLGMHWRRPSLLLQELE